MRKEYRTISLPQQLVKVIDLLVKRGILGYRSRSEYLVELLRHDLKFMINNKILTPEMLSALEE